MIPKEIQYMMFSSEPEAIPAAPAPQKVETQGCLITTILTLIDSSLLGSERKFSKWRPNNIDLSELILRIGCYSLM